MIELVFGLSLLVLALLLWWLGLRRSWQWILHSVTERVERHRPRRVPTLEGDRGAAQLRTPFRDELEELTRAGLRQARRLLVLLLGSSVVLVGIAMIILPGPALVVIPTGLSILALEFVWARRWLEALRTTLRRLRRAAAERFGRRGGPEPEARPEAAAGP